MGAIFRVYGKIEPEYNRVRGTWIIHLKPQHVRSHISKLLQIPFLQCRSYLTGKIILNANFQALFKWHKDNVDRVLDDQMKLLEQANTQLKKDKMAREAKETNFKKQGFNFESLSKRQVQIEAALLIQRKLWKIIENDDIAKERLGKLYQEFMTQNKRLSTH